jgi:hypothetical protein
MADTEMNGTRPLPDVVHVDPERPPRHTPRELQMVEGFLGKSGQEMTGGEAEQAMAFFALRRLGFMDVTWDQAADVFLEQAEPDPPIAGPATSSMTSSPASATTGA